MASIPWKKWNSFLILEQLERRQIKAQYKSIVYKKRNLLVFPQKVVIEEYILMEHIRFIEVLWKYRNGKSFLNNLSYLTMLNISAREAASGSFWKKIWEYLVGALIGKISRRRGSHLKINDDERWGNIWRCTRPNFNVTAGKMHTTREDIDSRHLS